jgi:hypothetical protein
MEYKLKKIKELNILWLERGASIMFAILILSFVLGIALGTSILVIRQVKVMGDIGYSVVAFYAADAGIEQVLMTYPPVDIPETPLNGASYKVSVNASSSPDCSAKNYCIKSTGSYKSIRRAIEATY